MELPTFLNKLTKQNNTEIQEYFWAFQLWDGEVKSAIWTVEEGHAKIIILGERAIWEETAESLVEAVDQGLSTAVEKLGNLGQEPSKVIFGLPDDWLSGEKILPQKQHLLQVVCDKLGLRPLGFVLTVDALNHHLKDLEGIPPSAVLVSPHPNHVLVALLNLGKVAGVEMVSRSDNLAADVYEGLLRFKETEVLPARILLFDGEDMEDDRQVLMDFSWQQKLPFLHFPKIEILPQDFDIAAVCIAGGSEVAVSLGLVAAKIEERHEQESLTRMPDDQPVESRLGFVQGRDVLEAAMGGQELVEEAVTEEPTPLTEKKEETPQISQTKDVVEKKHFSVLLWLNKVFSKLARPAFPRIPRFGLVAAGTALLMGAAVFGLLWFFLKAEIVVYVSRQTAAKDLEFKVDPGQEVLDEQGFILPGRIIEAEIGGSKESGVTGKKLVGDKAKGEVMILNNTAARKSLPAGTIVSGHTNLKFILDRGVEVASRSGTSVFDFKPGQVTVGVTAADIGAVYNLAAGSLFTVAGLPLDNFAAKNESTITGGTSRQIQAVSEEDQKKLADSLLNDLRSKSKAELLSQVPSGRKLIEETITTKEAQRTFDHQVGDEATTLSLSLKIKASALTFSKDDFASFIEKQLLSSIPAGYEKTPETLQSQFEIRKIERDGSVQLKSHVAMELLPQVDFQKTKSNLVGRPWSNAQEYLRSVPGYLDAEIKTQPFFLSKFPFLPGRGENILLRLQTR